MNWVDWAIVAIVLISTAVGIGRGVLREVLSLATWLAAVVVAMVYKDVFAVLLTDYVTVPGLAEAAAFTILFLAVWIIGRLTSYIATHMAGLAGLNAVNRLFGAAFGALRGFAAVLGLLVVARVALRVEELLWWQQSLLIDPLLGLETEARLLAGEVQAWLRAALQQVGDQPSA